MKVMKWENHLSQHNLMLALNLIWIGTSSKVLWLKWEKFFHLPFPLYLGQCIVILPKGEVLDDMSLTVTKCFYPQMLLTCDCLYQY